MTGTSEVPSPQVFSCTCFLSSPRVPHTAWAIGFSTFTCLHCQPMAPLCSHLTQHSKSVPNLTYLWKKASKLGPGNTRLVGSQALGYHLAHLREQANCTSLEQSARKAEKSRSHLTLLGPRSRSRRQQMAGCLAPHRGTGHTGQQFQHRGPRRAQRPSPAGRAAHWGPWLQPSQGEDRARGRGSRGLRVAPPPPLPLSPDYLLGQGHGPAAPLRAC